MSLFRKPDLRKSELSHATMTDYGAEVDTKIRNCVSGLVMATLPIAICSSSASGREPLFAGIRGGVPEAAIGKLGT